MLKHQHTWRQKKNSSLCFCLIIFSSPSILPLIHLGLCGFLLPPPPHTKSVVCFVVSRSFNEIFWLRPKMKLYTVVILEAVGPRLNVN